MQTHQLQLTQTRHFCVLKVLLSNYFNLSLITFISYITELLLICKFTVSIQVRIFTLNMREMVIYLTRWREKHLWKRGLIKYTYSWGDKLFFNKSQCYFSEATARCCSLKQLIKEFLFKLQTFNRYLHVPGILPEIFLKDFPNIVSKFLKTIKIDCNFL